jgi:hypothetical protein
MKKAFLLATFVVALATSASAQTSVTTGNGGGLNLNLGFGVNLISTDQDDYKATMTIAAKYMVNEVATSESLPDNSDPFALRANKPDRLIITLGVVAEDLQVNKNGTPRSSFMYSTGGPYQKVSPTSGATWKFSVDMTGREPGTLRIFLKGTVAAGRSHTTFGGEIVRAIPILGRALTTSKEVKTRPGSASAFPVIDYTGKDDPDSVLDWQVAIRRYIREKGVVPLFTPRDLFPQAPALPDFGDVNIPSMGGGNPPAQTPVPPINAYTISKVPASILKFVITANESIEVELDYRADQTKPISQADLSAGWVRKWSLKKGQSTPVIRVDGPTIELRINGTTMSKEELTKILQDN